MDLDTFLRVQITRGPDSFGGGGRPPFVVIGMLLFMGLGRFLMELHCVEFLVRQMGAVAA